MIGRNMGIKNLAEKMFSLHFSANVFLQDLRQQYAWGAKVFHQPSFLARHSYSPLSAENFPCLSSPAVE
jgi:hypothetical protein